MGDHPLILWFPCLRPFIKAFTRQILQPETANRAFYPHPRAPFPVPGEGDFVIPELGERVSVVLREYSEEEH